MLCMCCLSFEEASSETLHNASSGLPPPFFFFKLPALLSAFAEAACAGRTDEPLRAHSCALTTALSLKPVQNPGWLGWAGISGGPAPSFLRGRMLQSLLHGGGPWLETPE